MKGARESRRGKMTLLEVVGEDFNRGGKALCIKSMMDKVWSSPGKEGKPQYGRSQGCGTH